MSETVAVESALGPRFGQYHRPEAVDDRFDPEIMPRSEAEERGYSQCNSCFGDGDHNA